ncbi:MAG: flavodoxin family protein [Thermoprotei archaeon]|nr:MAG: flavodoxin family protein [Thermoprotei archaeon]
MKPKIILINGSPRKYGNVAKLLKIAEKGIIDAGGEAEVIHLCDYNIKPCMGCVSDDQKICKFPCIIDDDFNKIGEKILRAQGLIIGTPIYWYNVSGILKNFIDRLTSMENMIVHIGSSLLDGKVAGFIAVGNDSGSIEVLAQLMITLNSMGALIPPWAIAYHHTLEDVLEDKQAVLDSYNIGYNVVITAKSIVDIKKWYRVVDYKPLIDLALKYTEQEKEKQFPSRMNIYAKSMGAR